MSDLSQRLTVAELRRQQMEQFREANPDFAAQVDAVLEPITQLLAAMRAELDEITGRDRGSTSAGSSRPTFAGSPTSAVGATPLAPATLTPAPSAVTGHDGEAGGDPSGFPVPNSYPTDGLTAEAAALEGDSTQPSSAPRIAHEVVYNAQEVEQVARTVEGRDSSRGEATEGSAGDRGAGLPTFDEDEPDDGHDMFLLRIGVCPETGGEHQMVRDGDERGTYWACENCGVQES